MFLADKLKPRTIGQIFDQAVKIYRRNFLKYIGLMIVPLVLSALLTVPLSLVSTDPTFLGDYGFAIGVVAIVGTVISAMFQYIAYLGVVKLTMDDFFFDKTDTILATYQEVLGAGFRIVIGYLALLVLAGLLFASFIIPCVGWALAIPGVGGLMYLFLVLLPVAIVVVVAEQSNFFPSLSRAWSLARRDFWWVLGFVLLMSLFIQIVSAGPSFIIGLVGGASNPFEPNVTMTVIQNVITVLLTAISGPLQMICLFLLYVDLRIKTEGLDIALMSAEEAGESINSVLKNYPVQSQKSMITGSEVGYFCLVTIGWVALAFVFVGFFTLLGFGIGTLSGAF